MPTGSMSVSQRKYAISLRVRRMWEPSRIMVHASLDRMLTQPPALGNDRKLGASKNFFSVSAMTLPYHHGATAPPPSPLGEASVISGLPVFGRDESRN
jgi:hypothetical protein